jgi:septum formation protein
MVSRLITEPPFVLASSSPRRKRILAGLDLEFTVEHPGVAEDALDGETPEEHVTRLALEKASEVAARHEFGTVLGADTIVLLDGRILGKPADAHDARKMLCTTRGRWHEVFTGIGLVRCSDGVTVGGCERTRVLMRDLTDEEVDEYVASGEPLDKAGSYGIQECGAAVVDRVDGCFYNVVGLPVARLCRMLEELAAAREHSRGEGRRR